jgi:Ni/Co efflux regulator RcnB
MKFKKMNRIGTILLGATLTAFTVAAQNHGDDRDRDRDHHQQGRQDYHFRPEDKGQFGSHYKSNIREVQKHPDKRHGIHAGEQLPADYRSRLKAVPRSYYRNVPPPPPGYQFGYYDGYVVAYNPTTRIVADALDLIDAATH